MGTLIRIKLYAEDQKRAAAAFQAAFERIHELDETLSDYKPDSELNRIARTAVAAPVAISGDLFHVLAASQRLAKESGGAFDVTLGPVIRLWRESRNRRELPDEKALRDAGNRCGFTKLHLNAREQTVLLDQAGMQLDVGGIAKGYAADQALACLKSLGIRSALIAASGDLAFGGAPPGKRGWKIGIDSGVLELANAAVSTSGDTEQHLDLNGARYSHIVDPSTGMALTNRILVSVKAPRGVDADGLSTAISILGCERGRKLAAKYPGASVVVCRN
ncbi:MAG: FAD:protein FMN transferase [Acidobacteriota bacterium]|nr:FAD:protein FMN transferase [Acidobacteriota bacterium]